jgi:hypothetical protein
MRESKTKFWKRVQREQNKKFTPSGKLVKDLPAWQISAKLAASTKREKDGDVLNEGRHSESVGSEKALDR